MHAARAGDRHAWPIGPAPLNRAHPLGRQVVSAWVASAGLTAQDPNWKQSLAPNASSVGLLQVGGAPAWSLPNSTDALRARFISPAYPFALGLVFRPGTPTANANLFCAANSTVLASRSRIGLRVGASSTVEAYSFGATGAGSPSVSSNTITAGRIHVAVAIFTGTSSRVIVLDGVAGTENTTASVPSGLDQWNIGQGNGSTLQAGQPGEYLLGVVWGTAISLNLAREFCRNPAGLFLPSRRLWVAPFVATGAEGPGATLRAAARLAGGGASAVRNATGPGATLRAAARFAGGGASTGQSATGPGATLRAAARLAGGGATAVRNTSGPGATLRAAARFAGGGAFVPGVGGTRRRYKLVIGPSTTF